MIVSFNLSDLRYHSHINWGILQKVQSICVPLTKLDTTESSRSKASIFFPNTLLDILASYNKFRMLWKSPLKSGGKFQARSPTVSGWHS